MAEGNAKALEGEQTLKGLLEFLSKLMDNPDVRQKVITEIKEKVEKYFKDDEQKFGNPTTGYLFETIDKSKKLRRNIVKSEENYEHYTSPFQDSDANKYTQHLINNIFALFGCLYYMYFECSFDCYGINGGRWYDNKCDGSGSKGQNLNQWLTDQKGDKTHMISRGYQKGDLGSKTGNDLFGDRGQSSNLLSYTQSAELQWALYFMLFLPTSDKWNRGQSGHAVLFLKAFCEDITGGEFDDDHTASDGGNTFSTACKTVTWSIQELLSSNTIVPVASSDTVKYKDLMADEHFSKYIEWLKQNLEGLIKSLTEMKDDVTNWDEAKLKTSNTYGPYPWGFTFEYKWEEQKAQLNEPLQKLIQALTGLKNALPSEWKGKRRSKKAHEKSLNPTDSIDSSASTVGRVIGGVGAAAATAGAAYAGSSFLGPVAEGVGKFVRGLFF